jgi:rhamnose transport system permease protein
VLWLAFYGAAETTSALGFEFTTVTVVVIGGMNIWGGSGSIRGVILGALILTGVTNALVIANVSVNWQQAVNGAILLVAVSGNVMLTRRTARRLMLAQRAREKQIAAVG